MYMYMYMYIERCWWKLAYAQSVWRRGRSSRFSRRFRFIPTCIHDFICVCINTLTYMCVYVHTHIYIYIYIYICVRVYTNAYAYMHTRLQVVVQVVVHASRIASMRLQRQDAVPWYLCTSCKRLQPNSRLSRSSAVISIYISRQGTSLPKRSTSFRRDALEQENMRCNRTSLLTDEEESLSSSSVCFLVSVPHASIPDVPVHVYI